MTAHASGQSSVVANPVRGDVGRVARNAVAGDTSVDLVALAANRLHDRVDLVVDVSQVLEYGDVQNAHFVVSCFLLGELVGVCLTSSLREEDQGRTHFESERFRRW